MSTTQSLITLFNQYIKGFVHFDAELIAQCYSFPCMLHTPDNVVYLADNASLIQEISQIIDTLKQADIIKLMPLSCSYVQSSSQLCDVCIVWAFIDKQDEIYADFSAFYQIHLDENGNYKIKSVISHQIENVVELPEKFELKTGFVTLEEKQ